MAAPAAAKNLLFGLLAMQVGLVNPDELLGTLRVWIRDKNKGLADLLMERGRLERADREAIDILVARHLGRPRRRRREEPFLPVRRRFATRQAR